MPSNEKREPVREHLDRLHLDLGLKRLNPAWAKLEILLGLLAASSGLLLGIDGVLRLARDTNWLPLVTSVVLQSLGIYLAMAGHRSHIYQSNNKLAAWLANRLSERDDQLLHREEK